MTTPLIDANGSAHKSHGPGGGQFTSKTTAPASSALSREQIDHADSLMHRSARALVNTYRIDGSTEDDIVQDTWVHFLERDSRRGDLAEQATQDKLVTLYTKTLGQRYGQGAQFGLRSEDYSGRRALREREDEFERDNGRRMNNTERKQAADEVRLSFPAGARPKPDFYEEKSMYSMDMPLGDGGTTYGDVIAEHKVAEEEEDFDAQSDQAAVLLHSFEEKAIGRSQAKAEVWNVLSVRTGAPKVARGAVDQAAARTVRKTVADAGGAHALSYAWLDGDATVEQEQALFAPWGDIDINEMQQVVDVLQEYPSSADKIWGASLAAAA